MRLHLLFTTLILGALLSPPLMAQEAFTLDDEADRVNYTIGQQIGKDFKRQQIELDEQSLTQGLRDASSGNSPKLEPKEMSSRLSHLKRNITQEMKQDAMKRLEEKKAHEVQIFQEGERFLEENAKQPGIVSLPSGLQYRVLKAGEGNKPGSSDFVSFRYLAMRRDGKVYDSKHSEHKPPARHRVSKTPPGVAEALQMMQLGAKWKLFIPPKLAYGRQGPFAHQVIIIDIELLNIEEPNTSSKSSARDDS